MSAPIRLLGATTVVAIAGLALVGCGPHQPKPGTVLDEAMRAKRTAAIVSRRRTKTISTTWTAALPLNTAECKAATCGSCGPAATIASGTCFA